MASLLDALRRSDFSVDVGYEEANASDRPNPPFITSTYQQRCE